MTSDRVRAELTWAIATYIAGKDNPVPVLEQEFAAIRKETAEQLSPWTHHNNGDCYSHWDKNIARCVCGLADQIAAIGEGDGNE